METLLAPLRELEEFTQLKIAVAQGSTPVNVIGALDAQKCHFIYGLAEEFEFRRRRYWRTTTCTTGTSCTIRLRT